MSTTAPSTSADEPVRPSLSGTIVVGAGGAEGLDGAGKGFAAPIEEALEVEPPAVAVVPDGQQEVTTTWLFRPDEEPRQFALAELPHLVSDDDNFAWVNLSGYTQKDLRAIAAMLHLHPAAVHLTLSSWTRPRLYAFKDQFFVSVTVARLDSAAYRVQAGQLDLFVGRNYLLSVHKLPLPIDDQVLARAYGSPELVKLDAAFMLYIILDELLAYYERLYEQIEGEIETMEERALTDTSDDFLEDLLRFKRYAFALSQLVEQHREVFAAFLRPDFTFVSGQEVDVYFRDLENRLARLVDALLAAKDAVNGAFDIYVSHVSHRTNQVIKVLTMVSTILLPVTVILGLFSTSIQGLPLDQPVAFLVMVVCILLVVAAVLFAFRRRGWI